MKEQNLANSYRPRSYSEVVGQSTAVNTLKRISAADGIACRALFMKGAYGSGKCVHPDTVVKTSGGLRLAGDVVGGEKFCIAGRQNGFVASAVNSEQNVYIIRTGRGRVLRVTGNHPILVWDADAAEFKFRDASSVRVNDIVLEDCSPACSPEELASLGFDGWYWLIGAFLGAGCLLDSSTKSLVLNTCDSFVADTVVSLCRQHYISHVYSKVHPEGRSPRHCINISRKSNLYLWMKEQGMLGVSASGHSVPKNFYALSLSQQASLAKGLLDVRGICTRKSTVEFSSQSDALLYAVSGVVSALGFVPKIHYVMRATGVPTGYLSIYSSDYCADINHLSLLFTHPVKLSTFRLQRIEDTAGLRIPNGFAAVRRCLKEKGVSTSMSFWAETGLRRAGTLSFRDCLRWESVLSGRGVDLGLLPPCGVPDVVESISRGVCAYTVDLQCAGEPIFAADGVITHNTTLSRIFAKSMNCEHFKSSGDVCQECDGCKEASAANSGLYWELDGTVVGNVEGIRNLKERLSVVPAGRRVVVLDEVQAISQAAADALLKIVEEGVPSTIFVFCGTEDIRPALRSRCVNIDISVIPLPLIEEHIGRIAASRGLSITSQELGVLAMKSGGHMRDALQLLQFYELAGPAALDSSYVKFRQFVASCFVKGGNPEAELSDLLLYSTADIRTSVGALLRGVYTAPEGSVEQKMFKAGLGKSLFGFFFSPVAQQAMNSEVGMEVLLRSLVEKTAGSR